MIRDVFLDCAKGNIPQRRPGKRKVKKSLPYWNDDLARSIKDRENARKKFQRSLTVTDRNRYHELRANAQRKLRTTSRDYWEEFCSSLNTDSKMSFVWNKARTMKGMGTNISENTLLHQGREISDSGEKANLLADYFGKMNSNSNYSPEFLKNRLDPSHPVNINMDCLRPELVEKFRDSNNKFEFHELASAIRRVKNKSSPGEDLIAYEMIKKTPRSFQKILLNLYNRLFLEGVLPKEWSHAIVIPLLKPGKDPRSINSYRPISLTSCLCKIFERMVTDRLTWFLESNDLLKNSQSGFRKGRGCIDQMLRLYNVVETNLKKGSTSIAVFLDFEKAFDMVWQDGLLYKLKQKGIHGHTLKFISNFLSDRTMQVQVGGSLSGVVGLDNGTVQGAILSPVLFLVMIDDLSEHLENVDLALFADDSTIFKSSATPRL